jgi:hypothetical protein
MASKFLVCVECLSSTIKTFSPLDGLAVASECFSHCTDIPDVIHPLSIHASLVQGVASSGSSCFKQSVLVMGIGAALLHARACAVCVSLSAGIGWFPRRGKSFVVSER